MSEEKPKPKYDSIKYESLEKLIETLSEPVLSLVDKKFDKDTKFRELTHIKELKELNSFETLKKWELSFKFLVLLLSIIFLFIVVVHTEKSEVLIPIITLILGFVLNSKTTLEITKKNKHLEKSEQNNTFL